ncbi:MAG: Xaa-Pro dipeptidase [Deltaproteobacteria bacterium]|nr:Xaa-Pro dipeptidase [Deltaproteobacteria bacterium]
MSTTELYREHLETLDRYLGQSLERAEKQGLPLEGVLFHSGRAEYYPADDQEIVFRAAPHFLRWVPLNGPEHLVLARPGQRPQVVRVQPQDYWYDTTPPAESYWEGEVDLKEAASFAEGLAALGSLNGIGYVGSCPEAAQEAGIPTENVAPDRLIAPLDWFRAYKTSHEVGQLTRAAEKAAAGHEAARQAFAAGASEREIHWTYLEASDQLEWEIPYGTIVALDDRGAVLHYQHKRGREAAPGNVLLLDAGAAWEGQAADITRTWARPETDPVFLQLLTGMDALERRLVALCTPGRPYLEVHLEAHRGVAELLVEGGLITGSPEETFEKGLTHPFLPHGVGHQLGLQVHDVGGHQAGPDGGKVPPPQDHPYLRNTRILEPGQVVTIEPGLYFIPMLLEPFRSGPHKELFDWDLIDRLTPCGGIRIEDNILCTEGEPLDFTRGLIEGPRGS